MLVEITGKKNEEVLTTTSKKIADFFEKEHKNVLRDIEEMQCSEKFRQLNYELSTYVSEQSKTLKAYNVISGTPPN
jgi:phage regulatory protein, rha family